MNTLKIMFYQFALITFLVTFVYAEDETTNNNLKQRLNQSLNLPAYQLFSIEIPKAEMTEIPKILCNIKNVHYFNLSNNNIASIDSCIENHALTLESFILNNNKLVILPKEIGNLKRITNFEVEGNSIEKFPSDIGNMATVEYFVASNNKLKTLPTEFGNLTNLKQLDLSHNEITELPIELSKLTGLTILDLSNNKLTKAPAFLPYLVNINTLNLKGNPFTPGEIAAIKAMYAKTNVKLTL